MAGTRVLPREAPLRGPRAHEEVTVAAGRWQLQDGASPVAPTSRHPEKRSRRGRALRATSAGESQRLPMLKFGLVFFLLEIVSKFSSKLIAQNLGKLSITPVQIKGNLYHVMQMPKNACSAMHTGHGVMSLVPICRFI